MNVPSQHPTIVIRNEGNTGFGTAGLIFSILGWLTCGILSPIGALLSMFGLLGRGSKSHAIAGLLVGFPGVIFLFTVGIGLVATMLGLGVATTAAVSQASRNIEQTRQQSENQVPEELADLPSEPQSIPADIVVKPFVPEPTEIIDQTPTPVTSPKEYEMRTWTAKSGTFTTLARFVSTNDGNVTIEKTDGKQLTIALEKLADSDVDYVASLATKTTETEPTDQTLVQTVRPLGTCRFVKSNRDRDGNFMKLYAVNGLVNFPEFRQICVAFRKEREGQDRFQCLVLFDEKKNAAFPKNLYSAYYGIDVDTMMHVKAFYTFNPRNSFSELITYSPNMAEGKPNIESP